MDQEKLKYTAKGISPETEKWIFEDGKVLKLHKKQHLFLTRGTRLTRHFTFPAAVLRTVHKKLLQAGYSITEEEMKVQPFVFDIKGMQLKDGSWIKFEED